MLEKIKFYIQRTKMRFYSRLVSFYSNKQNKNWARRDRCHAKMLKYLDRHNAIVDNIYITNKNES